MTPAVTQRNGTGQHDQYQRQQQQQLQAPPVLPSNSEGPLKIRLKTNRGPAVVPKTGSDSDSYSQASSSSSSDSDSGPTSNMASGYAPDRPTRNRKPPEYFDAANYSGNDQAAHHVDGRARTRAASHILNDDGNGGGLGTRGSRSSSRRPSGTKSYAEPPTDDVEEEDAEGEEDEEAQPAPRRSGRRKQSGGSEFDSAAAKEEEEDEDDAGYDQSTTNAVRQTRSGRVVKGKGYIPDTSESEEVQAPRRRTRSARAKHESDGERSEGSIMMGSEDGDYGAPKKSRAKKQDRMAALAATRAGANGTNGATRRSTRNTRGREADSTFDDSDDASGDDDDDDLRIDMVDHPPRRQTRSSNRLAQEDSDAGVPGRRNLRERKSVNYQIPTMQEWDAADVEKAKRFEEAEKKKKRHAFPNLPLNMTGRQYDRLFGIGGKKGADDDSDDEGNRFNTPGRGGILGGSAASAGMFGGGMMDPSGLSAGTPNNMGKVAGTANLADIDPLGVQQNIDFSYVGGMDGHIQQLKEMVSLPLLYPEVFQRFNITPPRGVLFHGPPGTGKTLLARALAASCSTEGQKISFFMRKGADCLSKWVGEAERQLRLLFEEAKNVQPSIIFFDEIDGLAPVRSSKQEQIHASIVSTLLALMDGMDGRGQVVVIGATNRPDAIDPALRRPGRFDREFYFPLPNREARLSIINIHTRGWDPPLEDSFKDELAAITKGYGGADLRALCTEAALNAVQRRYPQIYKTNDRLLIEPSKIDVVARDFTVAQKHLIPSTARSASSAAQPLPPHIVPLLADSLERAKAALKKVLPEVKKPNVLEEAEYEVEGDGGFEREKMLQNFETLRVFRPRLIVCGEPGMGQGYIGGALLHHLEGFHVQTIDLANLVSDSTITPEARCVQLFAEAKRHKPSILYIPSLHAWSTSVTDTVKSTIKGLLDELDPSDPILLLAVVDGPFQDLPSDLRSWFGFIKSNRVLLGGPDHEQRQRFFEETIANIRKPPSDFPDAVPRRKRVLEVLPKAPPRAPREPTKAELDAQLEQDGRLVEMLKFRLGPVLTELKKKHRQFCKQVGDPDFDFSTHQAFLPEEGEEPVPDERLPHFYEIDLETMHFKLYYNEYLTPDQFVRDIDKMVHNAELTNRFFVHEAGVADVHIKANMMLNSAKVMVDAACEPHFKVECARMYERMKVRNPELGKQKKKEKPKPSEQPAPPRQSGRTSGKDPEFNYDPNLNERALKRTRSAESNLGDPERDGKRSRPDGVPPGAQQLDGAPPPSSPDPLAIGTASGPFRLIAPTPEHAAPSNGAWNLDFSLPNGHLGVNGFMSGVNGAYGTSAPEQPLASTSSSSINSLLNGVSQTPTAQPTHSEPSNVSAYNPFAQAGTQPTPAPQPQQQPIALAPHHFQQQPHLQSFSGSGFATPEVYDFGPGSAAMLRPDPNATRQIPEHLLRDVSVSPQKNNGPQPEAGVAFPSQPLAPSGETSTPPRGQPEPQDQEMQIIDPPREPTPEPPVVYPPFELDESALHSLADLLAGRTASLAVDELEQLRAACYEVIWTGRKEWNRNAMVTELSELAVGFIQEADEARSERKAEAAAQA